MPRYELAETATLERLVEIRGLVEQSFGRLEEFRACGFREFKAVGALPQLATMQGIAFGRDITIRGELGTVSIDDAIPVFLRVLHEGGSIGSIGRVGCEIGFEEKQSSQSRRAYDTVLIEIRRGTHFVSYSANGSKVGKEVPYRLSFIREMIGVLGLPLVIDAGPGGFVLAHSASGELWISQSDGPNNENPAGFRCSVDANATWDDLLEKAGQFVKQASKRVIVQSWICGHVGGDSSLSNNDRIYHMAADARLPAKAIYLSADYLINSVYGLGGLRLLCGVKDEIATTLCSVPNCDVEIEIRTRSEGHKVVLVGSEADVRKVREKLGSQNSS